MEQLKFDKQDIIFDYYGLIDGIVWISIDNNDTIIGELNKKDCIKLRNFLDECIKSQEK